MDAFHEGYVKIRISTDQPFLTLTDRLLTFSKSAIDMLQKAPYVHISINEEQKSMLVEACEYDPFSIAFVKEVPKGRQILVRWSNKDLLDPIKRLTEKSRFQEPIRIWGRFYPEHKAIKFDLTDIQPMGKNNPDPIAWKI